MKTDLSKLYRNLTAASAAGHDPVPHAHHLTQLVSGEMTPEDRDAALDRVSKSALESDLLRFALALEPSSQALSRDFAALDVQESSFSPPFVAPSPYSRRGWGAGRSVRRPIAKRAFFGASVAAALVLGLLQLQPNRQVGAHIQVQRSAADRIFAWSSDPVTHQAMDSTPAVDEIFRADFKDG